ncbi:hypothetical protein B0H12DRAFT_53668 [Mycena haematopus]|nr:hypothetical protein B0H12DRAFT_53668 [Mycena haematopus]
MLLAQPDSAFFANLTTKSVLPPGGATGKRKAMSPPRDSPPSPPKLRGRLPDSVRTASSRSDKLCPSASAASRLKLSASTALAQQPTLSGPNAIVAHDSDEEMDMGQAVLPLFETDNVDSTSRPSSSRRSPCPIESSCSAVASEFLVTIDLTYFSEGLGVNRKGPSQQSWVFHVESDQRLDEVFRTVQETLKEDIDSLRFSWGSTHVHGVQTPQESNSRTQRQIRDPRIRRACDLYRTCNDNVR